MKRMIRVCMVVVALLSTPVSQAATVEVTFNPNVLYYDLNDMGVLRLWGVPGMGQAAIKADPDGGWPDRSVIIVWYATLLKAQSMGKSVVIGYDQATLDILYVARPR